MIRINKFLSICGVTSRRGADSLIMQGKVTVNDIAVSEPGIMVDPKKDIVKVDGTVATPVDEKIYIILNKPQKVMTTLNDPFNRRTVLNYLKELKQRVYPVGRLDFDTRGLLMLTNDGELAFRLAHPSFVIEKVYEARVRGYFKNSSAEKISEGIELEDGHIGRGKVTVLKHENNESNIRIILTEGRKREVKQLCKIVGHPVLKLTRTKFAGLSLAGLASGQWRNLTEREIAKLKEMAGLGKVS